MSSEYLNPEPVEIPPEPAHNFRQATGIFERAGVMIGSAAVMGLSALALQVANEVQHERIVGCQAVDRIDPQPIRLEACLDTAEDGIDKARLATGLGFVAGAIGTLAAGAWVIRAKSRKSAEDDEISIVK